MTRLLKKTNLQEILSKGLIEVLENILIAPLSLQ